METGDVKTVNFVIQSKRELPYISSYERLVLAELGKPFGIRRMQEIPQVLDYGVFNNMSAIVVYKGEVESV
jgi:hypothetical protein